MTLPPHSEISAFVSLCIAEDVGDGDLTAGLVPSTSTIGARIISRAEGVICGTDWVDEVFHQLDRNISVDWHAADGQSVIKDQVICELSGPARGILTGERTALNLLQTLSGTASTTRQFADLVAHTATRILDTRKTIPGMRNAQKYAVTCGGGVNHRTGLYDGILLKENHLRSAEGISRIVQRALEAAPAGTLVEVEVESLEELEQVVTSGIGRVLLDNFSIQDMAVAVASTSGRVELEASGDIGIHNIADVAETGVDFISIGALTKNLIALDLSLLFECR